MFWDTHMHCRFSGDSDADPNEMALAAAQKGLAGICFTDHIDWDYPGLFPLIRMNIFVHFPPCAANTKKSFSSVLAWNLACSRI